MITFLIGHRGTGKTSLLGRVEDYLSSAGEKGLFIDLDRSIESLAGKTIPEIFASEGEARFRALEQKAVEKIVATHASSGTKVFVAIGAGFYGESLGAGHCLWIRRATDAQGRVFIDPARPRLDPAKAPLREYLDRYGERQTRFRLWSDEELSIPEGFIEPNPWEGAFFLNQVQADQAIVTLQPSLFFSDARLERTLRRRGNWNLRFELRDDLLNFEQLKLALAKIAPEKLIFSFRKDARQTAFLSKLKPGTLWDWPAEWPLPAGPRPPILSLHERIGAETVQSAGGKLEKLARGPGTILKLAVEVRDFDELAQGHAWAMEDPSRRAFLPRSTEGRWRWYRLFVKGRFPLAFIRDGEGSAPDQPTLLDWLRTPASASSFAAVLGDPVQHSFTPAEHDAFFRTKGMPVLAVSVSEQEWKEGALDMLRKLGLRAAAVTSPLKTLAWRSSKEPTADAQRLESVNTLFWSEARSCWTGTNTDLAGLQELSSEAMGSIAVWGGGGTLPVLREVFPKAVFFSARTGTPREGSSPSFLPKTVVWGVGRSRMGEGPDSEGWPDAAWRPEVVIDLNYTEDSPGREYAVKVGARYVSGLAMFRRQAREQRNFWESIR